MRATIAWGDESLTSEQALAQLSFTRDQIEERARQENAGEVHFKILDAGGRQVGRAWDLQVEPGPRGLWRLTAEVDVEGLDGGDYLIGIADGPAS